MTKLGQLYEKEKIEYGNERSKKATYEVLLKTAKGMLDEEIDNIKIMKITGLSETEILSLQTKKAHVG